MAAAKSVVSDAPESLDVKFRNALLQEDELGCVVRAHLHIEHLVNMLLEHHFPRSEALARLQLEYFSKVTLLEAFGYLPRLTKPLSAIGKLRNEFAHQLDFALTTDRMDALYNSFDQDGKQMMQEIYARLRIRPEGKMPKKMNSLAAKDRFVLFASTIRTMLIIAGQQTIKAETA